MYILLLFLISCPTRLLPNNNNNNFYKNCLLYFFFKIKNLRTKRKASLFVNNLISNKPQKKKMANHVKQEQNEWFLLNIFLLSEKYQSYRPFFQFLIDLSLEKHFINIFYVTFERDLFVVGEISSFFFPIKVMLLNNNPYFNIIKRHVSMLVPTERSDQIALNSKQLGCMHVCYIAMWKSSVLVDVAICNSNN